MILRFSVNYKDKDGNFVRQVFNKKAQATAFARKISKLSNARATLYKCNGYYDNDSFHEVESTFVAWYTDGKKVSQINVCTQDTQHIGEIA